MDHRVFVVWRSRNIFCYFRQLGSNKDGLIDWLPGACILALCQLPYLKCWLLQFYLVPSIAKLFCCLPLVFDQRSSYLGANFIRTSSDLSIVFYRYHERTHRCTFTHDSSLDCGGSLYAQMVAFDTVSKFSYSNCCYRGPQDAQAIADWLKLMQNAKSRDFQVNQCLSRLQAWAQGHSGARPHPPT